MNEKTFRILVTGSRHWSDRDTIWFALRMVAKEALAAGCTEVVVVHGCAPGADMLADSWVRNRSQHWPVKAERHPADWRKYGNFAGFRRNWDMVRFGADVCLAFPMPCVKRCRRTKPHDSHGTTHCAQLAEGRGIPTRWLRQYTDEGENRSVPNA